MIQFALSRVALQGANRTVGIYTPEGRVLRTLPGEKVKLNGASGFSMDGRYLAWVDVDHRVHVHHTGNGMGAVVYDGEDRPAWVRIVFLQHDLLVLTPRTLNRYRITIRECQGVEARVRLTVSRSHHLRTERRRSPR